MKVALSSSRRVGKRPGRRPQSAKRQRFHGLWARGRSVSAATDPAGSQTPNQRPRHASPSGDRGPRAIPRGRH
ncbi:hypothetical protein BST27_18445 [Mycobacterium intermedium]|uniref:Uncharacterized protein n=1 Tax=Mycobacterium intermedium TaxID=28445 RepID=A0A1T3W599_MYCIE|nr:hypothetical protein BV508_13785 [Mycobacterium intermedium]ORB00482.1 hypothetical protein BST27_18445 [Mycobacterium intermedium]